MAKHKVLIMEDNKQISSYLKDAFDSDSFETFLVYTPEDGLKILEKKQFDFIVSNGDEWKDCYQTAIDYYGIKRVVIYSGNSELVGQLKRQGYLAFSKGFINNDTIKSPGGLVDEVKKLLST